MASFREGKALVAEGKVEEGLAKLEIAVQQDPKNAEYRIFPANSRSSVTNRLIESAEAAARAGQISEAEKILRRVQVLEPRNERASQGLSALVRERQHQQSVQEAETVFKQGGPESLEEALNKVRLVLSENPSQKNALHLKARIDAARSKQANKNTQLAVAFQKPISLEFRDAPLKAVLEVVSKVSGLNFFYDRDIRPDLKATIFAKNTTIEDAVRLLLVTNQLEYKVLSENSVLIYPNTPQKLKDYQVLSVRSFYLTNADAKSVSNSIKTLLKTKDLVVDERLGIIIMRDTPEVIRMAERIVALQDLSDPEVVLDVEILEIKRSRLLELGIQWPSQLTLSPILVNDLPLLLPDLANIRPSTTQVSFGNALVNARKEDQDSSILANPRIRVRNREKAKIQIGDRVPVITTTSTTTGFASESVSYVDVGLKLEVEPAIYLDNEVGIKINLEVSNLVREITSSTGTLSYQIGTRGANTVLRLRDGETQVLAGLISDEDRSTANKVPGLGELPVAGRLFGSQKDDNQRSEILLSITPHIVRSIQRPDFLEAQFESGTDSNVGAPGLRLSSAAVAASESKAENAVANGTAGGAPPMAVAGAPGSKPNVLNPPSVKAEGPASESGVSKNLPVSPAVAPSPAVQGLPVGEAGKTSTGSASSAQQAIAPSLSWQAPAQVRVGEQFSMVLQVSSQQALSGMPVLVGFDPQLLQVVSVKEGAFFAQGGAKTSFSQRIDPAQGKVFAAMVRQAPAGADAGINGNGSLLTVTFKALKAGSEPKVQLLSANPEPSGGGVIKVPLVQNVRVVP